MWVHLLFYVINSLWNGNLPWCFYFKIKADTNSSERVLTGLLTATQETILHATSWIPGGGKYSRLSFTSEKQLTPICACKSKRRIWRHNTNTSCLFHKPTVVTSKWMQVWKRPSLAIRVKRAIDDVRNKIMIWLTMNSVLFGHHVKSRGASRLETATQYKKMRPMWTK